MTLWTSGVLKCSGFKIGAGLPVREGLMVLVVRVGGIVSLLGHLKTEPGIKETGSSTEMTLEGAVPSLSPAEA